MGSMFTTQMPYPRFLARSWAAINYDYRVGIVLAIKSDYWEAITHMPNGGDPERLQAGRVQRINTGPSSDYLNGKLTDDKAFLKIVMPSEACAYRLLQPLYKLNVFGNVLAASFYNNEHIVQCCDTSVLLTEEFPATLEMFAYDNQAITAGKPKYPEDQLIRLIGNVTCSIVAALQHLYNCGVIHCDVAPSNVGIRFQTGDNTELNVNAALIDLGIWCSPGERITRTLARDVFAPASLHVKRYIRRDMTWCLHYPVESALYTVLYAYLVLFAGTNLSWQISVRRKAMKEAKRVLIDDLIQKEHHDNNIQYIPEPIRKALALSLTLVRDTSRKDPCNDVLQHFSKLN